MKPSFSILAYGSTAYGFSKENHGKLNDIDLFLLVDSPVSMENFLEQLRMIVGPILEVQIEHLQAIFDRKYDICRIYAYLHGVKIGFRILLTDTYLELRNSECISRPLTNIAVLGNSRIIVDKEWSYKKKKYVRMVLPNEHLTTFTQSTLCVTQYPFSKRVQRLGVFGRKILLSKCVYLTEQKVKEVQSKILETHVLQYLKFHPSSENNDIINSIIRSERFSEKFRNSLSKKIDHYKKTDS